jgi:hypothetical protein
MIISNKSKSLNAIDPEYKIIIDSNPDKKFIMYLRAHTAEPKEQILLKELVSIFGECKELPKERLIIFIVQGKMVQEFINRLNNSNTSLYLSFVQSEDELQNK